MVWLLGPCLVLSLGGCIVGADGWVVKPRLNIEGRVTDKVGAGIPNQDLDLIVPRRYCWRTDAIEIATRPLEEARQCGMNASVRSDDDGCFRHRFPEWERFQPCVGGLLALLPARDDIFVVVKEHRKDGKAYLLDICGRRVIAYSLVGSVDDRSYFNKSDEAKAVSASVKKTGKGQRDIKFTLVQEPG